MSKLETPLTRRYWKSVGGTLIEEFPAVKGSKEQVRRLIDGILVLGGENKIAEPQDVNLEGRDIIVIQTKSDRLGMHLMGQAFFSIKLMKKFKPKTIKSVAICTKSDKALLRLIKPYMNIEVIVYED